MSINDPALAAWFGAGPSLAGVTVTESAALGVSSVWRAVSLIAGTIAALPLRVFRELPDGSRERAPSFLTSAPAGMDDDRTGFEWRETIMAHLLLWGNAYLLHRFTAAGGVVGMVPLHPSQVAPEWEIIAGRPTGRKLFRVTLIGGQTRTYTTAEVTHIPALSGDGLRGWSPISVARHSLGKAIAADRAAARMFSSGGLHSGIVTPEEDLTEAEAVKIKASLDAKIAGWEHAGELAVVNRKLKFSPWSMSMEDAQFLQSRQFEIEEVARWFGLLPIHLAQTEKQTSWGTGVAEQNRGLARFTLMSWTSRIEERLSRLLARPRFVEFDFAGLLAPAPEQEIALLIQQVGAGLITVNEARRLRGMDPIIGADTLRVPGQQQQSSNGQQPALEGVPQ